jgi:TonB family protein
MLLVIHAPCKSLISTMTVTLLALVLTLPTLGHPTKEVSGTPRDLAGILTTAQRANGLAGPNVRPWHIKVKYQVYDSDGRPKISGTYEEYWVSPKKYRRSYTSAGVVQIEVATDHGLYHSGKPGWPSGTETRVRTDLVRPMPTEIDLHHVVLSRHEWSLGQTELGCISLSPKKSNVTVHVFGYPDWEVYQRYCFGQSDAVLHFKSQGGGEFDTYYDNITPFQAHYVARDVRVVNEHRTLLTIHVESLESLSTINEADFVPPPGAIGPVGGTITVDSATLHDHILKSTPPNYPKSAKRKKVQGIVIVRATIGKDGHVVAAEALSGPLMLRQAAVACVRNWKYRPFLILGEPVQVESKIEFSFALAK